MASVVACLRISPLLVNAVTMNGPADPTPTIVPAMDVSLLDRGVVTQTSAPFWPMYFALTRLAHSSFTVVTLLVCSMLQPDKKVPSAAVIKNILGVFTFNSLK